MRILACLLALTASAHAGDFHFAEPPKPDGGVYLWPINAHLGYGYIADAARGTHAFALGLDVATFAWDAWLVDTAMLRMDFRSACARNDCGIGADFFLGSRVAWAHYLGEEATHQLTLGGVAGWGSIGEGWSGRIADDGHLVVGPSLRYAVFGLAGVEVMALVPVTGEVGEHRPVAVLVNLVGLGSLMVAVAGMR